MVLNTDICRGITVALRSNLMCKVCPESEGVRHLALKTQFHFPDIATSSLFNPDVVQRGIDIPGVVQPIDLTVNGKLLTPGLRIQRVVRKIQTKTCLGAGATVNSRTVHFLMRIGFNATPDDLCLRGDEKRAISALVQRLTIATLQ